MTLIDELLGEVARLKGITPHMPPLPNAGEGLPRYGLRWNGPEQPLATPMEDGYWTPWHLADAALSTQCEWRSFESAPKDGRHILVTRVGNGDDGFGRLNGVLVPWQGVVHYFAHDDGFYLSSGDQGSRITFSHWKPLCPSPDTAAECKYCYGTGYRMTHPAGQREPCFACAADTAALVMPDAELVKALADVDIAMLSHGAAVALLFALRDSASAMKEGMVGKV